MKLDLEEHIGYVTDRVRLERFGDAVARLIRPGMVVVDVGCGSGVLGLLCLKAGAARVWGIESTPMAAAARETFARAGLADRYMCIRGLSSDIELPEKADIAICDHVGYFGIDYGIIDLMRDAHSRFLKQGGRIVPSRIELTAGLVQSAEGRQLVDAWRQPPVPRELGWLSQQSANTKHPVTLRAGDIVSTTVELAAIDLSGGAPGFFDLKGEVIVEQDASIDGIAGWFSCHLAAGITMTNSPLDPCAIQRHQALFPIENRLAVKAGDRLAITIMARPSAHIYSWSLDVLATGQRVRQTTFNALGLMPQDLRGLSADSVLQLNTRGRRRKILLDCCDGRRSGADIETLVLREHPNLFATRDELKRFIATELRGDTE